jgi:hypothetical protein
MAALALWLYSKFPRLSRLLPDVTKECEAAKHGEAQQCWAGKSHVLCQLGSHEESLY